MIGEWIPGSSVKDGENTFKRKRLRLHLGGEWYSRASSRSYPKSSSNQFNIHEGIAKINDKIWHWKRVSVL